MNKRLLIWLLVLCLGWQSFALAGNTSDRVAADLHDEHALLHLHGTAHHHHDDGGIHVDDSLASDLHMFFDACPCVSILPAAAELPLAMVPGSRPSVEPARSRLSLFSQGLDRPPKTPT